MTAVTTPANPDDLTAWLRWVLDQREAEARLLCSLAGVSGTYLRDLLAGVDAKRRILDLHADPHECPEWDRPLGETCTGYYGAEGCPTLRLFALPFADRPGYREEWKP